MAINLDNMTAGYIEAMEFTDFADGDECHGCEMATSLLERAVVDCAAFIEATMPLHAALAEFAPDYDDQQFGRDFWLTRNGHGVGFWDREQLDFNAPNIIPGSSIMSSMGNLLSKAAEAFQGVDCYRGDDGKAYYA